MVDSGPVDVWVVSVTEVVLALVVDSGLVDVWVVSVKEVVD